MFKAQLIKIHRWFGLVMCLFFVTWFLSGFVMLYTDFPGFGGKDRLHHNVPLDLKTCNFEPARLSRLLTADTSWRSIRIAMLLTRPVFRLESSAGDLRSFYADNGSAVQKLTRADAEAIAVQYLHHSYLPLLTEKISELDQWIPRSYFLIHMPVYRITMNDPAATMIYISSKTGEIVQAHNRSERLLAWCGPIIHWIYPKELILRRPLWKTVVIFFSSLGIAASLSGIIVGFYRMRKKKDSGNYSSPYKRKWFRWHHYTGFIFGLFTFTWVFSGLLTMSPFGWSPEISLNDRENQQLQGGNMEIKSFTATVSRAFSRADIHFSPVEIELKRFQGRSYYIAYDANGKTVIMPGDIEGAIPETAFQVKTFTKAVNQLNGGLQPARITIIKEEDNYYYSKHNDNKLPVLKLEYNDPGQTWYYADLSNGTVVLKNNRSGRISRWLYHGLHSLDFFSFQHHRPVWDVLIILLLAGGTAVSITGLVIGVKKLKRQF